MNHYHEDNVDDNSCNVYTVICLTDWVWQWWGGSDTFSIKHDDDVTSKEEDLIGWLLWLPEQIDEYIDEQTYDQQWKMMIKEEDEQQ